MSRVPWLANRPLIAWPLRLALSSLFLYAWWRKLGESHAFAESVASFKLLPNWAISPAALTIPVFELLAGVAALLRGKARRVGAFCLLVLSAVFVGALAAALARGLSVDCGCFGADGVDVSSPTKNLWIALTRDLVLFAISWPLCTVARHES